MFPSCLTACVVFAASSLYVCHVMPSAVSSEEDEDDIFSDELAERGSDSESGDNEQVLSC